MPALIVIVLIVFSLYTRAAKSNAKSQKRPGPGQNPQVQQAQTVSREQMKAAMEAAGRAARRMADMEKELAAEKAKNAQKASAPEEHHAPSVDLGALSEGDSLSCEHGAVGGSMGFNGGHEGSDQRLKAPEAQLTHAQWAASVPRMSAEEMRRAVVMAEILKRPGQRRAAFPYK